MRVYISGKISGLETHVVEGYFAAVEAELVKKGHIVVNPMKLVPYDPAHTWDYYMSKCMEAILVCDAILMLENWRDSKGAKIEHAIAEGLGLKMYYTKNHDLF